MSSFVLALALMLLPPVDGPVVRRFEEPADRWAAGHRGIDYAVPPGTPVRAVAAGRVVFAGRIAGSAHVVVAHPGDLRSSYSFLAGAAVAEGSDVVQGQTVGFSGGRDPVRPHAGHDGGVVHLGLRAGGRYVDPGPLLGACGPAGAGRWTATLTPTRPLPPGIRTPAPHR